MKKIITGLFIFSSVQLFSQVVQINIPGYWQQKVKYSMDIDMNVATNRFTGNQKLEYWNNSPDTLTKVFYHLYWNAFKPGSMMDERSRRQGSIQADGKPDWDFRITNRIQNLKPDEIGYQKIISIKMNGKLQDFKIDETILEVFLDRPILPGTSVVFNMEFEAQVPIQIRRSGRDNAEGVKYSMSQWYPKLCEYDRDGWHPTPYVGREFYGVWGDFDVNISIDKNFIIGASGYLQNANQVGYGFETPGTKVNRPAGEKLLWHFFAPNVHDFVWAADPDFIHKSKEIRDGLVIHEFYKIVPELLKKNYDNLSAQDKERLANNPDNYVKFYEGQWDQLFDVASAALPFMETRFGKYPYNQFSFIQGGDGGMEYPMATLIKGAGPDVTIHEWLHSWYQGVLGTNESLFPWMDEGFATFAELNTLSYIGYTDNANFPLDNAYKSYYRYVKSGKEEPLTTHADHFNTNYAYKTSSYIKGALFLEQLGYITGTETRNNILLDYFNTWKFKHPRIDDLIHIAEKISNMKLDWYKEYWVNTTATIDYSIDSLWEEGGKTKIRLRNAGTMPMPIDFQLTFKDGKKELHYIPAYLMFGKKPIENSSIPRIDYEAWKWTSPTYIIETSRRLFDISEAEIDPTQRLADIERKNNKIVLKF